MEKINILFLGGAKRVSMARLFKRSGAQMGLEVGIVGYELEKRVPLSLEGSIVPGLRWSDPGVCDHIYSVMKARRCSVVIPFVDGAVAVAARVAESHPDVFAPCCDAESAERMFDKVVAAGIFARAGIPVPETYTPGDNFPLIAKPRYGSASKGIVVIDSEEALSAIQAHAAEYLIQRRIDRREEYTVDCYVSLRTGEPLCIVPRLRIEVEGGEVTRTATVLSPELVDLSRHVLEATGLRGAVTLQYIRDLEHPEHYLLMEINPRLGGGAVCSVYAQVDIPGMIMAEALGRDCSFQCYRPNTEISRYRSEAVFFN